MANIFFISDTHFGHENTWKKFKLEDGVTPLRPFSSTEEMDETMVENWNRVVQPSDHVYHLGDVVMHRKHLPTLARLNGHKRLVRGNHDIFPTKTFLEYFDEIYGVRTFPGSGLILSHIPLHPGSLGTRWINVHGHLHGKTLDDNRYFSVCVEQTNYTPVSLDWVCSVIKERARNE
jgi:calcineurin-like phosphoesterase family protein